MSAKLHKIHNISHFLAIKAHQVEKLHLFLRTNKTKNELGAVALHKAFRTRRTTQ